MNNNLNFDAAIFDLDGVITKTAKVHGSAWKKMFDDYLRKREKEHGEPFKEFTHAGDYLPYVDGKPRYQGVQSFLESRGIELPYGNPGDDTNKETICGLANQKNIAFTEILDTDGVEVYESTVNLIQELKKNNIKIGVASSSKNCKMVLERVNLLHLFETRVDGIVSAEIGLKGKPNPDIFTTAAKNLGVTPHRSIVFEDAVSGVEAGKNGNFGLVLGLAREDNHHELRKNGADIVLSDISEITLQEIDQWFQKGIEQDSWQIKYYDYDHSREKTRESILTLGNGYLGTRGAYSESTITEWNYPGTYMAGVYNRLPSTVSGRTVYNEDFVNCPNWLPLTFKIDDGNWIDINNVHILSTERTLDIKKAVLTNQMTIQDENGNISWVESKRLVSMKNPHLAAIHYKITPLNYSGQLTIKAMITADHQNEGVTRYNDLNQEHLNVIQSGDGYLVVETTQSKIKIANTFKINLKRNDQAVSTKPVALNENCCSGQLFHIDAKEKDSLIIEKLVSIFCSKESDDPLKSAQNNLKMINTYKEAEEESKRAWEEIWKKCDIKVGGDRLSQKLLRLHTYHLYATASPHNNKIDAGIPARGLSGEAYRGHIFWDELFILPFYNMNFPEVSKAALMYRYNRLEAAKTYAKEAGFQGAMFPWQSGNEGTEETQTLHLNPLSGKWGEDFSCLQRHISLAVAYNIWTYYQTSKDLEFLQNYGAEIFFEVCRFWQSKCELNNKTGKYEIKEVMGPDEFHEQHPLSNNKGLKDNAYTNLMVSWLFETAGLINQLCQNSKLISNDDLNKLNEISTKLNVIMDNQIMAQFDGFFELEEVDWDAYKEKYGNIYRMDRLLKAEGKSPNHFKAIKQADTLMLFYNFDQEYVSRLLNKLGYNNDSNLLNENFHYYLKRTSHGSTLSRIVHAYLAYQMNEFDLSFKLYQQALTSDYNDAQGGTTAEGIHTGVMAATCMMPYKAYLGMSIKEDKLYFTPSLPKEWSSLRLGFDYQNTRYEIKLCKKYLVIKTTQKQIININGQDHTLNTNEESCINLKREKELL